MKVIKLLRYPVSLTFYVPKLELKCQRKPSRYTIQCKMILLMFIVDYMGMCCSEMMFSFIASKIDSQLSQWNIIPK